MKIEKHNAHGLQLVVTISRDEALNINTQLRKAINFSAQTGVDHFIRFASLFEDDNDKWEPTEFAIVIEAGRTREDAREVNS